MGRKIIRATQKRVVSRKPKMTTVRLTILEGQAFVRGTGRKTRHIRRVLGLRSATTKRYGKLEKKQAPRDQASRPTKTKKISQPTSEMVDESSGSSSPVILPTKIPNGNKPMNKVTQLKTSSKSNVQIPSFGFIDVCFCLDATGSMSGQIQQVKSIIESIIHNIESKVRTEGLQLRFAIVSYRDHPPQDSSYVTKINDFTDNFQTIEYVKTLQAGGGGDEPEAVHDGLYDSATKLRWAEMVGTPVLRYIFHIADAPPHGKEFLTNESKEGCLCGKKTDDVINEINKKQIHYRLIKVRTNPRVDEMERIFQSKMMDFGSADIKDAHEMNVKVSQMIICEILPSYA